MKKPKSGKATPALLKVLEIQEDQGSTQDEAGNITRSWVKIATVRAKIEGLPGQERWQAQQALSVQPAKITIRYRGGIHAAMRLYEPATGKYYAIQEIPPQEIPQWLEILCVERDPTTAQRS